MSAGPLTVQVRSLIQNSVTIGCSMAFGDTICQRIQHDPEFHADDWWNTERTGKFGFVGCFVSAPISYCWLLQVEHMFPGTEMRPILQKTVFNAGWAFVVSLPLMFTSFTLLNGGTFNDAAKKVKQELIPTFSAGLVYWPFVNIWMFKFVSQAARPVTNSLCGIVWNIWLSSQAGKKIMEEEAIPSDDDGDDEGFS